MQVYILCDCCGRKIYEDDGFEREYGTTYCLDCWNYLEEIRNDNSREVDGDQREDQEHTD